MDLSAGGYQEHFKAATAVTGVEAADTLSSPEFLMATLAGARIGTWRRDMITGLVTWDAVTSEIFGLDPAPVTIGAMLPVHEDDRDMLAASLNAAFFNGAVHDMEFRAIHADGTIRWLRGRAQRLTPAQGQARYLAGTVADVSLRKSAEAALMESERQLRTLMQNLPGCTYRYQLKQPRGLVFISDAVEALTGYARSEFASGAAKWEDLVHPDDLEKLHAQFHAAAEERRPYQSRHRIIQKSGAVRWVEYRASIAFDAGGAPMAVEGFVHDVHDQTIGQQRLRDAEERYRLVSRATMDLIWDWDLVTDHLSWNEALESCFGYSPSELGSSGTWWSGRVHPDDRARVIADVHRVLASGDTQYAGEYRFQKGDGSYAEVLDRGYVIRDGEGKATRMVGAMQDLSDRKKMEERLVKAATVDQLTNLTNRAHFVEAAEQALAAGMASGRHFALALLDLDGFKEVNDSLGHDAGDALLKTVASRLTGTLKPGKLIARLGGDEFALLLTDIRDEADALRRVQAVVDAMREPFLHMGRIVDCHVTIGLALCPVHGKGVRDLLKNADIALYAGKAAGGNTAVVFSPEHRAKLQERLSMLSLARAAIRQDRIVPHYQPKIDLRDGSLHGFEALLRWNHDERGMQLPATITAAFDDLEIANSISDQIIDKTIADMRRWLDRGLDFGHVAVNAAAAEFRRDNFGETLLNRLDRAGIPRSAFQLEVTETVFLGRGAEYVERALKLLSAEGVSIALDDFGTGYASLRHLKQFPVHVIKVDRSFVRDMETDPEDCAIVEAVVNLGRSLKIDVVAEGIETASQSARLQALGCAYGQGFLFSAAVDAASVPAIIARWPRRSAGLCGTRAAA